MMEMTHNPWLFSSVNPGKYATYKYRKAGLQLCPSTPTHCITLLGLP